MVSLSGRQTQFYIDIVYGIAFSVGFGYLLFVGMDPSVAAFQGGLVLGYFLRVWEKMTVYEQVIEEEVAAEVEQQVPAEAESRVEEELESRVDEEVSAELEEQVSEEVEDRVSDEVSAEVDDRVGDIDERIDEAVERRVPKAATDDGGTPDDRREDGDAADSTDGSSA